MDVIDAHIESFVWTRVAGYRLGERHVPGLLGGRLWSQVDLPRLAGAGMAGGVFSIATNPLRPARSRQAVLQANVARLRADLEAAGAEVVADAAAFRRARARGRLACFVAVQGGNAAAPEALPDEVSRVTLVHLTRSHLGAPARPGPGADGRGLTVAGRAFVRGLNRRRVLVDLAHANRRTFWDALEEHDRSQPAIVSHTGVSAVHPCWRNVDDDQISAVAGTGGVVGIMYHCGFLGGRSVETVVDHVQHVIDVAGDDHVCLGSDWDGLIVTPPAMRTVSELPRLLEAMRHRGFSEGRLGKVAGGNYLRVMESIRPG